MKYILSILLLLITFNLSFSQKILRMNIINNFDSLLTVKFCSHSNVFKNTGNFYELRNSETFIKTYPIKELENINQFEVYIYLRNKKYNQSEKSEKFVLYDLYQKLILLRNKDTLHYSLNVDSLGVLLIENYYDVLKKQQEDEENKILYLKNRKESARNRISYLLQDADDLQNEYRNKLNGKKYNKAEDILYEDGFSRTFDYSSSVIKEVFRLRYNYDTDTEEKDEIKLKIELWHSYGYGNCYYDISIDIYLVGFGNVVLNSKITDGYYKLFED